MCNNAAWALACPAPSVMILVTISIYIPCLMVGFLMKECEHGKLKDDSQKCTLSPHTFTVKTFCFSTCVIDWTEVKPF